MYQEMCKKLRSGDLLVEYTGRKQIYSLLRTDKILRPRCEGIHTQLSQYLQGGAMVQGNLPVPGRPTISITVEPGRLALALGAGGGCLDVFTLICPFSTLSPSLWETARYRLKYCLKGPLNPKQPTSQPTQYLQRRCSSS